MDAHTVVVPAHAWPQALRDITARCGGWSVRIELLRDDIGDQPLLEGPATSLEEITLEDRGSEAGNILIDIGDFHRGLTIHRIVEPRRIFIADTLPGEEVDVRIESSDGTVTLIGLARPRGLPGTGAPGRAAGREPRHQRAPVRIGRQQWEHRQRAEHGQ